MVSKNGHLTLIYAYAGNLSPRSQVVINEIEDQAGLLGFYSSDSRFNRKR